MRPTRSKTMHKSNANSALELESAMTVNRARFASRTVMVLAAMAIGPAVAAAAAEVVASGEPLSVRLSPSQYRQSIADIFGSSISITGRFEPETRDDGLLAVGARKANITD